MYMKGIPIPLPKEKLQLALSLNVQFVDISEYSPELLLQEEFGEATQKFF